MLVAVKGSFAMISKNHALDGWIRKELCPHKRKSPP
jgi:hypothetical protein